jgi:hypothetical protein
MAVPMKIKTYYLLEYALHGVSFQMAVLSKEEINNQRWQIL